MFQSHFIESVQNVPVDLFICFELVCLIENTGLSLILSYHSTPPARHGNAENVSIWWRHHANEIYLEKGRLSPDMAIAI